MNELTMPADTARLLKLATTASVLTALLLIVGKTAAWLLTGSISVLASLVDSLMDAAASIINLVAVRVSLQPPDEEHRFGHGKVEPLAALAQAAFIAGSAVFLVLHAVDRLMHPRPIEDVTVGIAVMGFAVTATAVLLLIQRHVIRRTRSTIVRADSLHYTTRPADQPGDHRRAGTDAVRVVGARSTVRYPGGDLHLLRCLAHRACSSISSTVNCPTRSANA